MKCIDSTPVTNDTAGHKDYRIKRGYSFVFGWVFYEDDDVTPLDVSEWEFSLITRTQGANPTEKLAISTADWARPAANVVRKEYSPFTQLPAGKYAFELRAIHPTGLIQPILEGEIVVV